MAELQRQTYYLGEKLVEVIEALVAWMSSNLLRLNSGQLN